MLEELHHGRLHQIQLLTYDELGALDEALEHNPSYTKVFLKALVRNGVQKYIRNIDTTFHCLKIDDYILPITVNDTEYNNAHVISPYGLIACGAEELAHLDRPLLSLVCAPLFGGVNRLLQWGQVNKVVVVNNWLTATNLYPSLTNKQIRRATDLLQQLFPQHAIVWRSLTPELVRQFKTLPTRLMFSRKVYCYDPAIEKQLHSKQRWNIKTDRQLIAKNGYEIVLGCDVAASDIPRMQALYSLLYLKKHSKYNPQLTEAFFKLALESE